MKQGYEIKRSKRKTLSIEVTRDLRIIVRAPKHFPEKQIDQFVSKHQEWIEKTLERQSKRLPLKSLSQEQVKELKRQAKEILPQRVEYYSELMQLYPTAVKITSAEKRFGSCNGKNGICFSYRLMLYPKEAVDYVVVHELAHIKHKNHSRDFYELIGQYMPDYKKRNAILKSL